MTLKAFFSLYLLVGLFTGGGLWRWTSGPPLHRGTQSLLCLAIWPLMWPVLWEQLQQTSAATATDDTPDEAQEAERWIKALEDALRHSPLHPMLQAQTADLQPIQRALAGLLHQERELSQLLQQQRFSIPQAQQRLVQLQHDQDEEMAQLAKAHLHTLGRLHQLQQQSRQRFQTLTLQIERLIAQLTLLRFAQGDSAEALQALHTLHALLEGWDELGTSPT